MYEMYITKCNANRRMVYCLIEGKYVSPSASLCSQNSVCWYIVCCGVHMLHRNFMQISKRQS